jgi:hypothetical protein
MALVLHWRDAELLQQALEKQHRGFKAPQFRNVDPLILSNSPDNWPLLISVESNDLTALSSAFGIESQCFKSTTTFRPSHTVTGGPSPFAGLRPVERSPYFYGREAESKDLHERFVRMVQDERALPWFQIVGSSGVGKSSLAWAGLLAVLPSVIDSLRVAHFRPALWANDPIGGLARNLSRVLERLSIQEVAERLQSGPGALRRLLQEIAESTRQRVVLFIDPIEEIFTWAQEAQDQFGSLLSEALRGPQASFYLLTALQIEHKQRLKELRGLEGLVDAATSYYLAPMDERKLVAAIQGPTERDELKWSDHLLPEQIARNTLTAPGGLPALGVTLHALWRARQGTLLLKSVYEALGGVEHAVAVGADKTLAGLSIEKQRIARRVLTSLVRCGRGQDDQRRMMSWSKVIALAGGDESAREFIRRLYEGPPRTDSEDVPPLPLLEVHHESDWPADERRVELAHEVLVQAWPTLRQWIEMDRPVLERWDEIENRVERTLPGTEVAYHPGNGLTPEQWGELKLLLSDAALSWVDELEKKEKRRLSGLATLQAQVAEEQSRRVELQTSLAETQGKAQVLEEAIKSTQTAAENANLQVEASAKRIAELKQAKKKLKQAQQPLKNAQQPRRGQWVLLGGVIGLLFGLGALPLYTCTHLPDGPDGGVDAAPRMDARSPQDLHTPPDAADHSRKFVAGQRRSDVRGGAMVLILQHLGGGKVKIFWIDETEVTVAAYKECLLADGVTATGGRVKMCTANVASTDSRYYPQCNYDPSRPDTKQLRSGNRSQYPMNCINRSEAEEFCRWARKRLPTEKDWELAALGLDGRKYPWGAAPLGAQTCWRSIDGTCPVKSHSGELEDRSPFNALDMAGNVQEWVLGVHPQNVSQGILRGGAWSTGMGDKLPTIDMAYQVGRFPHERGNVMGFRCAQDFEWVKAEDCTIDCSAGVHKCVLTCKPKVK